MKVNVYKLNGTNTGELKKLEEKITLDKNRWLDKNGTSHPLKYLEPKAFVNKNVYFLHLFGNDDKKPHLGKHISLTFWQNQRFRWMQKTHTLQTVEGWLPILISIASLTVSLMK